LVLVELQTQQEQELLSGHYLAHLAAVQVLHLVQAAQVVQVAAVVFHRALVVLLRHQVKVAQAVLAFHQVQELIVAQAAVVVQL
jgi:hypothetical protein